MIIADSEQKIEVIFEFLEFSGSRDSFKYSLQLVDRIPHLIHVDPNRNFISGVPIRHSVSRLMDSVNWDSFKIVTRDTQNE